MGIKIYFKADFTEYFVQNGWKLACSG